jgi:DMSO/TMAO reductase YedYZ molybdopterin-dependent catalytic subunit
VAWIAIGALLVHVAVKLPLIRDALRDPVEGGTYDRPGTRSRSAGLQRRGLVVGSLAAAGVAVLASVGSTVPALRRISVFGVRSGDGPQGIPINRSAAAAGVVSAALAEGFRLEVTGPGGGVELSRDDLLALPQHEAELPIACVEGWSASGRWQGPRLRDVLDLVGAPRGSDVVVGSLQQRGAYAVTQMPGRFADDPLTLLALRLDGETLALDHGYPCRIIAPNRPGVLQTKWVNRLVVRT